VICIVSDNPRAYCPKILFPAGFSTSTAMTSLPLGPWIVRSPSKANFPFRVFSNFVLDDIVTILIQVAGGIAQHDISESERISL
jgi:hypothetical protein